MHRKQRRTKARGLMRRAFSRLVDWLADGERLRHDLYCSAIEAELCARPWPPGWVI